MGFTAYPPDPHKGFEVPSAIISATLASPDSYSEGAAWTALILETAAAGDAAEGNAAGKGGVPANAASRLTKVQIYTEPLVSNLEN